MAGYIFLATCHSHHKFEPRKVYHSFKVPGFGRLQLVITYTYVIGKSSVVAHSFSDNKVTLHYNVGVSLMRPISTPPTFVLKHPPQRVIISTLLQFPCGPYICCVLVVRLVLSSLLGILFCVIPTFFPTMIATVLVLYHY